MNSMAPSTFIRAANRLVASLLRLGLPIGQMALLTVAGRRTGLPRSTPVALTPLEGGWSLGSPFGVVDWVRNLRVAGEAEITRRRRTIRVLARELSAEEAALILRANLSQVGPVTRRALSRYFASSIDAPVSDWIEEASRHPTFFLQELDNTSVDM